MDIEKVNGVLLKAINGLQEAEVEQAALSEGYRDVAPGSVNWDLIGTYGKKLARALKGRDALEALPLARKLTTALKPMVRRESMDFPLDEAKKGGPVGEKGLEKIRKICKEHQAEKIGGVMIDASSACLIVKIADKLNPANRKKFLSLDANSMGHIAWKLAS